MKEVMAGLLVCLVIGILWDIAEELWKALALFINDRKEDKEDEKLDSLERDTTEVLDEPQTLVAPPSETEEDS